MPRFYLGILLCLFSGTLLGQVNIGKYLSFADEQFAKGDYYYALTYYNKALEIDSNSVNIFWKLAETNRAYKDYEKAAYYYEKIYLREEALLFPTSLLQWALMEKQLGHYDKAIELFKEAKKKYAKNKKDYPYLKAKRELESCLWAQSAIKDTLKLNRVALPEGLNTKDAEFGHVIFNKQMVFSSLRADSISMQEEVYGSDYHHHLYTFQLEDKSPRLQSIDPLNLKNENTGNGAFSKDGSRYYYSVCADSNGISTCKIAVSRYSNGKWLKGTFLGDIVNEPGSSNTTPTIAYIDNEEWLIFSSNREESEGGMDLFFSILKNDGNQLGKVKKLGVANSIDQEICPWFDANSKRLYFSSNWWDGFGGYDIFYSEMRNNQFTPPVNAGLPFNSPANDNYFFKDGDTSYLSSNRLGVLYAKNPTCCSDIFAYTIPPKPIIPLPESNKETLADLNKRLPVTLYFHNDIPDPRSKETTTTVNYMDAYANYMAMIPEYKKEYSKGLSGEKVSDAEEDIENFFLEYVEKGVKDLDLFKTLLLEELNKGYRIQLSVRGFASPLAKTEYNVALTKRRIASLVNHLKAADGGVFKPYLEGTANNGGKLEVVGIPFGEYTANQITSDNPNDVKNSVFSRAAAIERKIEIQSVSYLDTDSLFFILDVAPRSLILGTRATTSNVSETITLFNNSTTDLTVSSISSDDGLFSSTFPLTLPAQKAVQIPLTSTKPLPMGIFSKALYIQVAGYDKPMKIMVLGEGK